HGSGAHGRAGDGGETDRQPPCEDLLGRAYPQRSTVAGQCAPEGERDGEPVADEDAGDHVEEEEQAEHLQRPDVVRGERDGDGGDADCEEDAGGDTDHVFVEDRHVVSADVCSGARCSVGRVRHGLLSEGTQAEIVWTITVASMVIPTPSTRTPNPARST